MSVQNGRTPPAVRTPDPLASSRRRALRRLGPLRSMALGAIGDIGSVAFGTTQKVTWETATDWNNAVSEKGVVHESTTNTDYGDAGTIQKGYATETLPSPDLDGLWLFQEDSGSTAFDFAGTAQDGSINGVTINQTPFLNYSYYDLDGADDHVSYGNVLDPGSGAFTWGLWVNLDGSAQYYLISKSDVGGSANRAALRYRDATGRFEFELDDNSSFIRATSTTSPATGTWYFVCARRNADDSIEIFVDGTSEDTNDPGSYGSVSNNADFNIGHRAAGGDSFTNGKIAYPFAANGTALSNATIQDLYDAVAGTSSLTTATKSLSTSGQPDLVDLTYSLNGGTVSIDVIGSPGTGSEEIVNSGNLDGTQTTATLSWTDSHTDFRVKPLLDAPGDLSNTPTVGRMALST